jgi:hypothetical protein
VVNPRGETLLAFNSGLAETSSCTDPIDLICRQGIELSSDVEYGMLHDPDEVQEKYFDPKEDPWIGEVVPNLKQIPRAELARVAGVTEKTIRYLLSGHRRPSAKTRAALIRCVASSGVGSLPAWNFRQFSRADWRSISAARRPSAAG